MPTLPALVRNMLFTAIPMDAERLFDLDVYRFWRRLENLPRS
jgi:hypothetical protein